MKGNLLNQKTCVCIIMLCLTGPAWGRSLFNCLCFKPYVGLEYQYEHIKPAQNYRNILSTDVQSGNFFLGTRFFKIMGLEVGYYRTLKASQQQDQVLSFNGESLDGVGIEALLTRTSFKGFSLDYSLYYALDPKFNISAIFGFATMHPTMKFEAFNGTDLGQAFVLITPKNRTVPRLGFGLELLKQHWGLRSRIFWVYTQEMQLNVAAAQAIFPAITDNPYVQAVQATVGIFYRF